MMEKWNIGDEKRMMIQFYFMANSTYVDLDLIPPNPLFQYSTLPRLLFTAFPISPAHGPAVAGAQKKSPISL
jgi:hypothetical protein